MHGTILCFNSKAKWSCESLLVVVQSHASLRCDPSANCVPLSCPFLSIAVGASCDFPLLSHHQVVHPLPFLYCGFSTAGESFVEKMQYRCSSVMPLLTPFVPLSFPFLSLAPSIHLISFFSHCMVHATPVWSIVMNRYVSSCVVRSCMLRDAAANTIPLSCPCVSLSALSSLFNMHTTYLLEME